MKNECEGCLSFSLDISRGIDCEIPPWIPTGEKCPCLTCLIKGMCHNSCDAFENYVKLAGKYIGPRYE